MAVLILRGQDRVSRPFWASSRPQFSQSPLPSPNKYSGSSWVLSPCWGQLALPTTTERVGEGTCSLTGQVSLPICRKEVGPLVNPWLLLHPRPLERDGLGSHPGTTTCYS